jgi:hypothetical protein
MGVPAADFFKDRTAEKHGCSRKRNDKAQAHETRQHPSKPRGIVDSKAACEPCVARVIKIEDPLQTGKFGRAEAKVSPTLRNCSGAVHPRYRRLR